MNIRVTNLRSASPAYVARPLCIEGGEVVIDAIGHYCGTSGRLMTVEINGNEWATGALANWLAPLCRNHLGNWSRDLTAEEIEEAAE